MFTSILVPLDGSERAEAILPHVAGLAGCFAARLILLQVVEPSHYPEDDQGFFHDMDAQRIADRESEAARYLDRLEEMLSNNGLSVVTRVEYGPVVETILQVADETRAELIAMASHGRSGLSQLLYGSVAAGVLHQADRPLFLIRALDRKPIE